MELLEHDWDRQREQLSALLDNELDEQERADLEAHLGACAECRAELESLRRVRALVRALPQPSLPRSFALPVEAPAAQEASQQAAPAAHPTPVSARSAARMPQRRITNRRRRPAQVLQWLSAIAALLGIILLLSSAFSTFSLRGASNTATTSAQAPGSAGQQGNVSPSSPTRTSSAQPGLDTPAPTTESPAGTPGTNGGQGQVPGPASASPASLLVSIPGLGALLLILSACGFAIAWALRRRW